MLKKLSLKLYGLYWLVVRSDTVGTTARNAFTKSNYWIYKVSDGRLWNKMGDADIILLETVGRKTGKAREFPLLGVRRGRAWIIIGSNAGRAA